MKRPRLYHEDHHHHALVALCLADPHSAYDTSQQIRHKFFFRCTLLLIISGVLHPVGAKNQGSFTGVSLAIPAISKICETSSKIRHQSCGLACNFSPTMSEHTPL
jgi:hypothetical protein